MRIIDLVFFLVLFNFQINSNPPKEIPQDLILDFTLNNQIPVTYEYHNEFRILPQNFTKITFNNLIQKAKRREYSNYQERDTNLFNALDYLSEKIKYKEVLLVDNNDPWIESILLAYEAIPVILKKNLTLTKNHQTNYIPFNQYEKDPKFFDFIFCISTLQYEGLGRYNEMLDPKGDLNTINNLKNMLTPDGLLILAIPIGPDQLVWNAHRIYGPLRLKLLLKGWKPIKYFGYYFEKTFENPNNDNHLYQPIFFLKQK